MRISSVQQGLIVEREFAKFLMMGSAGAIELAAPVSDDERRDYEIHVRGQYGVGVACQVKSAASLHRMSKNVRYLNIFFDVRADRLVNSPFYWYFFGYLDLELMGLADPTFLVPSTDFHKLAAPILRDGVLAILDGREHGAEEPGPLESLPCQDPGTRTRAARDQSKLEANPRCPDAAGGRPVRAWCHLRGKPLGDALSRAYVP